jgi:hypothetical protein
LVLERIFAIEYHDRGGGQLLCRDAVGEPTGREVRRCAWAIAHLSQAVHRAAGHRLRGCRHGRHDGAVAQQFGCTRLIGSS